MSAEVGSLTTLIKYWNNEKKGGKNEIFLSLTQIHDSYLKFTKMKTIL